MAFYLLRRERSCFKRISSVVLFVRSAPSSTRIRNYRETVRLPQTDFPLSMKDGVTSEREKYIQEKCRFDELYNWQSQQTDRKLFVLHDGPPYANGDPHVGHALNKILKDITNRYKLLQGHRIHYMPGWDCHGLPIEQKALTEMKGDFTVLEPLEIRAKAKLFAESAAQKQLNAFRRWGIMADWSLGCYYTFDRHYEATELEMFYKMYEKGFIYQNYMPVFWSPSSRTALAEAEIEYNDSYSSLAVYVKYPLKTIPDALASIVTGTMPHVVIWTTTPWTLPLNRAICYGRNIMYCFVKTRLESSYLIASEFKDKFSEILGESLDVLSTFKGSALNGMTYSSSASSEEDYPLLDANHVTPSKGTGLVHTAPAHGIEDFQVALKYGLPLECFVDEAGCYTDGAGSNLVGKNVLTEGTAAVLNSLDGQLVHQETFVHSYPHDWRSKQPLIIRASKQWFVDTNKLREKTLECLNSVSIFPKLSSAGMLSQLNLRSYWCISRQRVWGVPIPVFYEKTSKKPLLTRASIDHLKSLVSEHGVDCWWTLSVDELLTPDVIRKSGFDSSAEFERCNDILDIWFDSGISWSTVLKDSEYQADVYLEGIDQFSGWFQSSLLTRVALQDSAPYRSLVVHGFVLDEDGKKMSKSLGNVVDPDVVINGGENIRIDPAYGVDVLRMWVAQSGVDHKVQIGSNILSSCNERVFKMVPVPFFSTSTWMLDHCGFIELISDPTHSNARCLELLITREDVPASDIQIRKSLRYLMSNLYDFNWVSDQVSYGNLHLTDRFILHLLQEFVAQATNAYETFNYTRVVNLIDKFISSQISGFHSHVTKDRIYCGSLEERRSCQTVQYLLLEAVTKISAPILPHLCEEIVQFHPLNAVCKSVFKSDWFYANSEWCKPTLSDQFHTAFELRDIAYELLISLKPSDFDIKVFCEEPLKGNLQILQGKETSCRSALCEIFQSASVTLLDNRTSHSGDSARILYVDGLQKVKDSDGSTSEVEFQLVLSPAEGCPCPRCRRKISQSAGCLCTKCHQILASV